MKRMKKQIVQRIVGRFDTRGLSMMNIGVKRMIHIAIQRLYHLLRMFLQPWIFLCELIGVDRQRGQSKKDTANKDNSQPQNDDGKQFFRRIQVLYENNIPGATPAVNRLDGEVKRIFVLNVTGRTPPGSCRSCILQSWAMPDFDSYSRR